MAGGNEHFDYFIDFLFNSVEVKILKLITVIYRLEFSERKCSEFSLIHLNLRKSCKFCPAIRELGLI